MCKIPTEVATLTRGMTDELIAIFERFTVDFICNYARHGGFERFYILRNSFCYENLFYHVPLGTY
ncbi:hypothetical protein [Piscirickettsia salmonis]|nr:hypothetical protein [Piscirickettsia salmonis]QHS31733.1 hypothetical protein GW535_03565 [Piscirickettsia salmonis]